MKFICTPGNLAQGLARVVPLAGRNTQLPILQHVFLDLREGVLHAVCTDLEVGIHTVVPGKVESEGSCTVQARKFLEYIQQLPKTNPVTLELKDGNLLVETTGFKARFATGNSEDFPLLPEPATEQSLTLAAPEFCQALTRTLFAAARDTTRPEIHSVCVTGEATAIRIAATDGFRLVEEVMAVPDEQEPFMFLLPLPTTQEIVRLFNEQAEIVIKPQTGHVTLEGDGLDISSRLIDGKYPEYRQIIPQTFKTEGIINRQDCLRALKTVSVFLPRESRRVSLQLQPSEGLVVISVAGSETGEGRVEIDYEGEGDDVEILFNIQYLLEGMQVMPGETLSVQASGPSGAAAFKPLVEGSQYIYVVMPIQV